MPDDEDRQSPSRRYRATMQQHNACTCHRGKVDGRDLDARGSRVPEVTRASAKRAEGRIGKSVPMPGEKWLPRPLRVLERPLSILFSVIPVPALARLFLSARALPRRPASLGRTRVLARLPELKRELLVPEASRKLEQLSRGPG